jgi:uncharacterized protein
MKLVRTRFFWLFALLLPCMTLQAEKVADLPMPTRYVNDFAHVLTPAGQQRIEDLCRALHNQANADIAVVTIKSLDDQTIEEFTVALEEKWKLGKKGEDRSAVVAMSMNPRKFRIETGYGLEGILPDAKVGRIRDQATPFASSGDYDQALFTAVQGLADVIAADAHVTLTPVTHTYHRQQPAQQQVSGVGRAVMGIGIIVVLFILARTGHIGWLFFLLMNMSGGGGGRGGGWGGGGGGGGGGGFGGSGGGESGGGGASGDF